MTTLWTKDVILQVSKAVSARADYQIDWSCWLPSDGSDTIVASTWEVEPDGELSVQTDSFTATTTECFVIDGLPEKAYRIRNTITTAAGRIEVRSIVIGVYE